MGYADDHSLYSPYKAGDKESVNTPLEECLRDVNDWMCRNRLHVNYDKTEFVTCGSSYQLSEM